MLVTRRAGHLVLITQPEHGRVAGELAGRWGNRGFEVPAPREALICAALHHDDGWHELDGRPAFNPVARRPANFTELTLDRTVGPYARGVESVYARNQHAGALVGMHFSGFYTGRWGLGGEPALENPLAAEVVATQEARWMPALREAWGYRGPRSRFDADTWHAYEVLQALDLMSLALGLMDLSQPAGSGNGGEDGRKGGEHGGRGDDAGDGGEHGGDDLVAVRSTLSSLDQPAGPRLVDCVPTAVGAERVRVRLTPAPSGRLVVEPYPFAMDEFELAVAARELDDRRYASPEEAAAAFHEAPVVTLRVTIAAAGR